MNATRHRSARVILTTRVTVRTTIRDTVWGLVRVTVRVTISASVRVTVFKWRLGEGIHPCRLGE